MTNRNFTIDKTIDALDGIWNLSKYDSNQFRQIVCWGLGNRHSRRLDLPPKTSQNHCFEGDRSYRSSQEHGICMSP